MGKTDFSLGSLGVPLSFIDDRSHVQFTSGRLATPPNHPTERKGNPSLNSTCSPLGPCVRPVLRATHWRCSHSLSRTPFSIELWAGHRFRFDPIRSKSREWKSNSAGCQVNGAIGWPVLRRDLRGEEEEGEKANDVDFAHALMFFIALGRSSEERFPSTPSRLVGVAARSDEEEKVSLSLHVGEKGGRTKLCQSRRQRH